MVQTKLVFALLIVSSIVSCAPEYSWKRVEMDGHITGATAVSGTNIEAALGTVIDSIYNSPSGKVFNGGATPVVAQALINAQPSLAYLKEVLGNCPTGLGREKLTGLLPLWTADALHTGIEIVTGKKIDVAICNLGGIRKDMPSGDILLDDVVSIFPFSNKLAYSEIRGEDILWNLSPEKRKRIVWSSGMKVVTENDEISSIEIGGKPLDPNAYYRVGGIDFIIDGGDGIAIARNARELVVTEVITASWIERYIRSLTAEGKSISASLDDRLIVK